MEQTKLELQKEREFGEVFNATFAFIKQEFKPLSKVIVTFVLPILLVMSIVLIYVQTANMNMLRNYDPSDISAAFSNLLGIYGKIFIYTAVVLIGQSVFATVVYSYMKLYLQGKENIGVKEIADALVKYLLPVIGASILMIIVVIFGLIFCFLPGIYLAVSLSMFIPILIIENDGIGNAFSRSFTLTHRQWGWTFLILLVGTVIIWVISLIFSIPSMIMGFTSMWHSIKNHSNPYEMLTTGYIVYSSIVSVITQLLYLFPYILIGFQYFNIVEITERPSLSQKIDQLGTNE